jgi:hypothetical protein
MTIGFAILFQGSIPPGIAAPNQAVLVPQLGKRGFVLFSAPGVVVRSAALK